ncbi:MAG: SDR family NAD(P)-dependent oxidoreductase [Steroidobacteraceae bacterium]
MTTVSNDLDSAPRDAIPASGDQPLRFDGRVAVITGAGSGLGRAHALLLAHRGARVVVNDLGTTIEGEGAAESRANRVVEEIRAAGGEAIADSGDIARPAGAKALVERALSEYGRLDILINNAGVLRDCSFARMSLADFECVVTVHLLGSIYVTKAAWPTMQQQAYGRIVLITSHVGLYGNFGQTNYAAAKLGVVGFMNALKIEGRTHNILVNAVAPLAATRMTAGSPLDALAPLLKPERVSAVVAWLCHEALEDSGLIVATGGGYIARVQFVEGRGVQFDSNVAITLETVRQNWRRALDMSDSQSFEQAHNAIAARVLPKN